MPRTLLRLRSPLFVFRSPLWLVGALLAGSLCGAGCAQGIGDRCEVNRDCSTNFCNVSSNNPQNGICCDPTNTETCIIPGGTGGAQGSIAGNGGNGGAGGEEADGSSDGTSEAPAADSSTDGSDDAVSTD